jgi:HEAT repeat protein
VDSLKDPKIRMDALNYMERHLDAAYLTPIKAAMDSGDKNNDWTDSYYLQLAVRIIRKLKDRSSVPLLIQLIQGKREQVESYQALGDFGDARSLPVLIAGASDWKESSGWGSPGGYAARAIANFGAAGIDALESLLKKNPEATAGVAQALSEFKDPSLGPRMVRFLGKPYPEKVRDAALESIGAMKYRAAADKVAVALHDPSKTIRDSAVRTLAHLGDARAIPGLESMAKTDLGRYLGPQWSDLGPQALSTLKALLAQGDRGAAEGIAGIAGPASTGLLLQGLGSKDGDVVAICAHALGERKAAAAAPQLLESLNRKEVDPRYEAYMALRALGYRTG